MTWHARLLASCTVAVLATGCTTSDRPNDPASRDSGTALRMTYTDCTTIGNRVWFDVNCNGIQDKDESAGPEGIKITLIDCNTGGTVATTTTGPGGTYQFADVPSGYYKVCFELLDGYDWTAKHQGDNGGLDSDVNTTGCTDCFNFECEKPNSNVDAGICEKKGGGEGCTPGFWKNHLTHWEPTGYSPDMVFDEVFGCVIFGDDTTLLEAASPEISHNTLAAHGVAALLNAAHPGVSFGLTETQVIDAVCNHDKNTLSEQNEMGCSLSGGNTTGRGGQHGHDSRLGVPKR